MRVMDGTRRVFSPTPALASLYVFGWGWLIAHCSLLIYWVRGEKRLRVENLGT
jgi:hypothetical protein